MIKNLFLSTLFIIGASTLCFAKDNIKDNINVGYPSQSAVRVLEIESTVSDTVFAKVVVYDPKTSVPDTILTEVRFVVPTSADTNTIISDSIIIVNEFESDIASVAEPRKPSWSPKPKMGPDGLRFVWGAEFGSTIDMSGREMSSIDISASFGLGYKWLSFAGIGAGANIVVSNSCRTYPIFANLRTDFSRFIKFLFVDLRGGIALNYLDNNARQTGGYVSPSLGFNLASGSTFRSYLTVGYTFFSRKDIERGEEIIPNKSLSMATVRIGVAF